MENLLHPNKWFVAFCALFIIVFGLFQFVGILRLKDFGEEIGSEIYTFNWPEEKLRSTVRITDVQVVKKDDSDATLKIIGRQSLDTGAKQTDCDCTTVLKLYKQNNDWYLGNVELQ